MSDNTDKQPAASKPAAAKAPSHIAYQIRDTEDAKGY